MKMMSKYQSRMCDQDLELAKSHLNDCLRRMKDKYGTSNAVWSIGFALREIEDCLSNTRYKRERYQKFRNPPNTPKSRRLGWHNAKGETK